MISEGTLSGARAIFDGWISLGACKRSLLHYAPLGRIVRITPGMDIRLSAAAQSHSCKKEGCTGSVCTLGT
jgi:hypothetical protein